MRARALVAWAGLAAAACARPPSGEAQPAADTARAQAASPGAEGALQVAELGTCALESGERVVGCRVGYRTFGPLRPDKSNVVLWPTWFTGTTERLMPVVPGKLVDTTVWHLVLVDALADGVSSSPSSSAAQPRLAFPKITVRDMVESQRRLLVERLGVTRVRAVAGISMGGMQAFEWAVSHPEMVEAIVPIVGSPRLTSHDLLLWTAELHALTSDVAYQGGAYHGRPTLRAVLDIHQLALTTPEYRSTETSREAFPRWLAEAEADPGFDWNDWRRQLEAMLAHDVYARHGTVEAALARVRARALVVVAEQDHAVNPAPALDWARRTGAETLVLKSRCAHLAPGCEEQGALAQAIARFLSR